MTVGGDSDKVKRIVHDALVNADTIDSLVKGRVFTHHLQDPDLEQIEYPMVVLSFRTGRLEYFSELQNVIMELWAYSRLSAGDATKLYDLAKDVLQAERLKNDDLDMVVVGQEIERPSEGWSETTRSWFAEGRWLLRSIG